MKKFLLLSLLWCFQGFAQISFEKGYFINNIGKRTECYIENMDWRNNPTVFNYKLNPSDSESKTENIFGVSEFGIDNQSMYKRFDVKIERSQNTTGQLQKSKSPIWKNETLFLHALVIGEASLYHYLDGNTNKYFYETRKNPMEQLVFIRYIEDSGAKDGLNSFSESIQQNNQFRQQLLNNVNCGMTEKDFKSLEYNRNTLVKHFMAYNACAGTGETKAATNFDAASRKDRESFAWRVQTGIYSAKVSISDPQNYYNKSTDLTQMVFKAGIEAEYILPFNKGTWTLIVSPTYQKFSANKNFVGYSGFPGAGNQIFYTVTMDYSSIEIPFGVRRYFYLNNVSRIFANATYVIDLSNGGSLEYSNTQGLANADDKMNISSRNNFAIGVGYGYKRFSGELKYNFARQLSERLSWDIGYSSVGLNLGFKIF